MLKVLTLKYQEVNMSIPIIDFKDPQLLEKIREAYTTVGFAVFTNALQPEQQEVYNRWFDIGKRFFDLDLDTKHKYNYSGVELNTGYTGWMKENVDPNAPKDMKESFNYNDTRMNEKLWPKEIPDFKSTALDTIKIANWLTLHILKLFDVILESGTTLHDCHIENYSTTRIIHYPAYKGPIEDRQNRIGKHSDYGTITLLWQINDVPGLMVKDIDDMWHHVPYAKNGVIVNIGDLLQRWTNDYFVSTEHQVVNTHIDQPRYSMPHFVDPKPGTMVWNLRNDAPKYDPIESLEYLTWRLAQSY